MLKPFVPGRDNANKQLFVSYAKSITFEIFVNKYAPNGRIYFPVVQVEYGFLGSEYLEEETVEVELKVIYRMSSEQFNYNLHLFITIFGSLSILWAVLRTWVWMKRSGNDFNAQTFLVFIVKAASCLANTFALIVLCFVVTQLVIFKYQTIIHVTMLTEDQENVLIVYFLIAFLLKLLQVAIKIIVIGTVDIFFVDWERSSQVAHPTGNSAGKQHKNGVLENGPSVTIWRSYFIANEWFELCTYRRINMAVHVFALIICLEVHFV